MSEPMSEAEFNASVSEQLTSNRESGDLNTQQESQAMQEPQANDEIQSNDESQKEPENNGFLSYEEYIEQGMNPDFYRGKEAYRKQKEMIEDSKKLSSQVKELNRTMFDMQKFNEEQREQEQRNLLIEKAELEAELQKHRDALEIDDYEKTRDKIADVDSRIRPQEKTEGYKEPEFFTRAREQDPRITPASPGFDRHYNTLVEAEVTASIQQAANAVGRLLTDNELSEHLTAAKKAIDEKFKPAPKVRPAEVTSPQASTTQTQKIPANIMAQINKWSQSPDPIMRESAEAMKQKYIK